MADGGSFFWPFAWKDNSNGSGTVLPDFLVALDLWAEVRSLFPEVDLDLFSDGLDDLELADLELALDLFCWGLAAFFLSSHLMESSRISCCFVLWILGRVACSLNSTLFSLPLLRTGYLFRIGVQVLQIRQRVLDSPRRTHELLRGACEYDRSLC